MKKIGLVLEGGGLRGIFTAGVLDFFLDKGIEFDYVVGVSAGACNLMGYVAKRRGYYRDVVLNDASEDPFFGIMQMADSHKFVDLDKAFDVYAEKEHYDYDKLLNSKTDWDLVVSNINTGLAEYKNEHIDLERLKLIGKASCSIPVLTSPIELDGNVYLDGGICDSIPIKRAEEVGCDYTVVVATRRKGVYCHCSEIEKQAYSRLFSKKYPNFYRMLTNRQEMYIDQITYAENQEKNGKSFLIRPTLPETGRLEKDTSKLSLSYYHGYTKAEELYNDLAMFMNNAKKETIKDKITNIFK
ncbi:MAG: patatin family protein [Erysipelotrichaceae bacterium]|nr:patatin family protein [Erysipelotrichaceae bacterium]